ncbi:hypothetical protein CEXT_269631 [Caerostris extrusa]|uniref:Uncharacterized protein n=1 Tax=Caerostris extrusa TaxID=172846 RepID=A0AAV4XM05_CAEEX|nr:hypothetical protein CEXT_269631 [Caerostris extrusa]
MEELLNEFIESGFQKDINLTPRSFSRMLQNTTRLIIRLHVKGPSSISCCVMNLPPGIAENGEEEFLLQPKDYDREEGTEVGVECHRCRRSIKVYNVTCHPLRRVQNSIKMSGKKME